MSSFEFYLTEITKSKYMADFQKLLNLKNSEFWDLDDGVEDTLVRINENPCFQTLYSKKYKCDPNSWNLGGESYLYITSNQDSWVRLYDILNEIVNCATCLKCPIELVECDPDDNPNFKPDSFINIGCIRNPDHFKIKHFIIGLNSPDMYCHEKFWECVRIKFTT